MGHLQEMTKEQRMAFLSHKYRVTKEGRKGDSFPYWNEKLHNSLLKKGYEMYQFETGYDRDATNHQHLAVSMVQKLRSQGNYARIICGYSQNQQRIRMFTIYFKNKSRTS